jgi:hypothetical protein
VEEIKKAGKGRGRWCKKNKNEEIVKDKEKGDNEFKGVF